MSLDLMKDARIRIFIGHYGSGKTEFAVNYAMALSKLTSNVSLCDLDIVNPYFRSREKAVLLEANLKGAELGGAYLKGAILFAELDSPQSNPTEE